MGDTRNVTIIGAGLIGQSWAALMLAHGLNVTLQDVAEGFEDRVRQATEAAWPDLVRLGMAEGDVPLHRLHFEADIATACRGAGFIQECGPDRLEIKRQIIAQIEMGAGSEVVISTSTSSLRVSEMAKGALHPERILAGHPFNPPHLMPLAELVPGEKTSAAAMDTARAFYASLGREVIELKRDVVGHVANRLGSALFREAVHMVAEGIASVEDVDRAVKHGPGLRWALMGPFATYHLGGGPGGFRHYMEHLGPTQAARWAELGEPELDAGTAAKLIAGVDEMLAGMEDVELLRLRDEGLVGLLKLKGNLT
ncbi:3-hydroxyacyl-CoA dehydrogenase NAD-binding domain-containing protein [Alisedimentitalea sp. MJ-SS2]|uniref:3-hydroxyacyl-CoA dehydrogenase NAD-binding domain-containing protein n=1 Tax=Aliisedimentitalea sp. MJ-SS2 TaxID=3049795 RepID=UPI0029096332|nr:3-hydroxyacyl-CoA dehydrogenase NAD-binding domain-containing protein [Alisedimentitalea sp. MJ-SS2]MDU8927794.1 3-hydroxyacyl-CoA dehydrogenase NAD-binding domain-containing protein [Alisedimentitalea sp. MJ-SS2]